MTLDEAREHIGDGVVYEPRFGYGQPEDGVIVSVSDEFVFVRYAGNQHAKATPPAQLTLLYPKADGRSA